MYYNKKIILIAVVVLVFFLYSTSTANPTSSIMQPIDDTVRGQKNRNPLNIKKGGKTDWQGTVGYDSYGHGIFTSIEMGTRAALIDIKGKIARGLNTIQKLVNVWAEANTGPYANYVASNAKIDKDKVITFDKETIRKIVYYMAIWESKYKLSAEQFETAWTLANA